MKPAASQASKALRYITNANGEQLLRLFKWLAIAFILAINFASRHWFNPDYISYLEVGEAWLRGDFEHAVNGYWFPVFPIIVASVASLFPNNEWDPLAGHLVNAFLYIGILPLFHWFLRQLNEFTSGESAETGALRADLILLAYPVYLWCGLLLTVPKVMTADILVGASLLGAAGIVLRIINRGGTPQRFALLGLVLGLGYLSKVIMFSLSLAIIGSAVLFTRISLRTAVHGCIALLVFAAINAPHIALLSKQKSRLDLGDTGPLAYAWLVNDISPLFHWTGDPPGFGSPAHPPRKLLESPEVFSYSSYPHGTYPPFYDPSYWNEGLKPRVVWADQARAIVDGLAAYARIFGRPVPLLIIGTLIACALNARRKEAAANLAAVLALVVPTLLGLTMYLLVLVDTRYVGYILLIGLLPLSAALLKAQPECSLPKVARLAAWLTLLAVCAMLARETLASAFGNLQRRYRDHVAVARALKSRGLQPGDRIAVFGRACEASYARLAEVQIIAEGCTFHSSEEWLSDSSQRNRAVAALRDLGLRAVVLEAAPDNLEPGWSAVQGADYSIYFFPPN